MDSSLPRADAPKIAPGWRGIARWLMGRQPLSSLASARTPQSPATTRPPALTHHEIMGLIEPFARCAYRLRMSASDRLARSLLFEPDGQAHLEGCAPLGETLELHSPRAGSYRLTRTLVCTGAPPATVTCEGSDVCDLLQRLLAADMRQAFVMSPGYAIAWQRRLHASGRMALAEAVAQVQGVTMTMAVPRGGTGRAGVQIEAPAGSADLPDDLFAVLGCNWSVLRRAGTAWRLQLRLRGHDAEGRFEQGTRHLARTLAEPPRRFHQRHLGARWAVSARRSMLLAAWAMLLGLVALVAAARPLPPAPLPAWPLWLASLPLATLWWCLRLDPMPQLRWPRRPRAPDALRWLEPRD